MSLISKLENIRSEIGNRIKNSLGEDINDCIVGRKDQAYKFKPPLIWVLPEPSTINPEGMMALHEDWFPVYHIIGISMKKDPEDARKEAESLAIRASASLFKNPTTGNVDKTLGDLVHYIKRIGWSPGDTRIIDNETLHGAAVQIKMRFETEEVE